MTKEERIALIKEAQDMIIEAQGMIDDALCNDDKIRSEYEAYGKFGFDQLLNNGNPYDSGLSDLVKSIEKNIH